MDALAAPTQKQLEYIDSLGQQTGIGVDFEQVTTRGKASEVIEALIVLKDKQVVMRRQSVMAVTELLTEGMYRSGGEIYKVQRTQDGDRLYAKRLTPFGGRRLVDADESVVSFEFQYEQGAIRKLTPADKLSLDEARQFGLRYGFCCVCASPLKNAESVKNGIGPVCGQKFSWR